MRPGEKVRRKGTQQIGVIQSIDGSYAEVGIGADSMLVHIDDLELAAKSPTDLLIDSPLGGAEAYALRLQSLYLRHAYKYDRLSGLSNARIEPTLHQVYIAHRVTGKLYPRMILADEVGLGKTIEAGLIIKELRARELVDRVLIICPASLQIQWKQELLSKFNEDFEIMDGDAARFMGKAGVNPWTKRDNLIASLPFAASPKRAAEIAEADWDLVIFDEAHRVRRTQSGSKTRTTQAYELADELKESVEGLLLLSATPMQLHQFELFSLIELVEPGLYPGFDVYEAQRKLLPPLNELMKGLIGWEALLPEERARLLRQHGPLLKSVDVDPELEPSPLEERRARDEALDALSERHPLTGVLVRNRRSQVLDSPVERKATRFLVPLEDDERQLYEDVTVYLRDVYNASQLNKNKAVGFLMVTYQKMLASSSTAIHSSLRKRLEKLRAQLESEQERKSKALSAVRLEELSDAEELSSAAEEVEDVVDVHALEWEIEVLADLVSRLGRARDSKGNELLTAVGLIFQENVDERLIIFTQFIETQEWLGHVLRHNGYTVNLFNGRLNLDRKEEEVRSFRDKGQILISTEAGGEGRNFQFCHFLVNYDLPWNPMKVEQRIGRLDRIGQKKNVYIYNLACEGTVEERVLNVLDERIGLFEESVGSLDPILGQVEGHIEQIVMSQAKDFDVVFNEYEKDIEKKVLEAKAKEQAFADFALDRSSFRRDEAQELLDESPLARWTDLRGYVDRGLAYFGGMLTEHADGGDAISLTPRLQSKMKVKDSLIQGTFDPESARIREDLPFFAFGHEVVDNILALPIESEPVLTAARSVASDPSGVWVEILYSLVTQGVTPSGQLIRHLVNEDLEVRSEELMTLPPFGRPSYEASTPSWSKEAVRASRLEFEKAQSLAREEAERQNQVIKQDELLRAQRVYDYRRNRLERVIDEQRSWIAEKEVSGSDRDKRVLPARKGGLRKNEERLQRLKAQYEYEVDGVQRRAASVSAQVLAAGVVVGG